MGEVEFWNIGVLGVEDGGYSRLWGGGEWVVLRGFFICFGKLRRVNGLMS